MEDKRQITKISIVCATGAETYQIGDKGIAKFKSEVIQIAENMRASFYIGEDKEGNQIVLISASAPIVLERS